MPVDDVPTAGASVGAVLDDIAAGTAAPGGGSVSALAGALGAALGAMVCRLTADRESVMGPERATALAARLDDLRARLLAGFDVDQRAYEGILVALRLPKAGEDEKAVRRAALAQATRHATLVPLENARLCVQALECCEEVVTAGLPQAVTDAGVGAAVAYAGLTGALYNVYVNLSGLDDEAFVAEVRAEAAALTDVAEAVRQRVDRSVRGAIGA